MLMGLPKVRESIRRVGRRMQRSCWPHRKTMPRPPRRRSGAIIPPPLGIDRRHRRRATSPGPGSSSSSSSSSRARCASSSPFRTTSASPLAFVVALAPCARRRAWSWRRACGCSRVDALERLHGVFHAGVEWKWCLVRPSAPARRIRRRPAGSSTDCSPSTSSAAMKRPGASLGLSLAGYNALISAALAAVALWGAKAAARRADARSFAHAARALIRHVAKVLRQDDRIKKAITREIYLIYIKVRLARTNPRPRGTSGTGLASCATAPARCPNRDIEPSYRADSSAGTGGPLRCRCCTLGWNGICEGYMPACAIVSDPCAG